jgi:hypothetical protein
MEPESRSVNRCGKSVYPRRAPSGRGNGLLTDFVSGTLPVRFVQDRSDVHYCFSKIITSFNSLPSGDFPVSVYVIVLPSDESTPFPEDVLLMVLRRGKTARECPIE